MDVRLSDLGGTPLIEVWGDIDHSTCSSLEDVLMETIDGGDSTVFIDLHQVTYIDSGGLSVLLAAVRLLREQGWLGVIGPNANVHRLLEIVGLLVDPSFRVFENRSAAENFMNERTPI